MKQHFSSCVVAVGLFATGCGNPSVETGTYDRDAAMSPGANQSGEPSSLFEVTFGGGEAEVTKNLPADAADQVGKAIKSIKGKSAPDITK